MSSQPVQELVARKLVAQLEGPTPANQPRFFAPGLSCARCPTQVGGQSRQRCCGIRPPGHGRRCQPAVATQLQQTYEDVPGGAFSQISFENRTDLVGAAGGQPPSVSAAAPRSSRHSRGGANDHGGPPCAFSMISDHVVGGIKSPVPVVDTVLLFFPQRLGSLVFDAGRAQEHESLSIFLPCFGPEAGARPAHRVRQPRANPLCPGRPRAGASRSHRLRSLRPLRSRPLPCYPVDRDAGPAADHGGGDFVRRDLLLQHPGYPARVRLAGLPAGAEFRGMTAVVSSSRHAPQLPARLTCPAPGGPWSELLLE